jgi:hypothetical protein
MPIKRKRIFCILSSTFGVELSLLSSKIVSFKDEGGKEAMRFNQNTLGLMISNQKLKKMI